MFFKKKIIYNKHDVTYGAIAQLGERYAGSVEVRGSSPLGSIPLNPYSIRVFCFEEKVHSLNPTVERSQSEQFICQS